MAVLVVMLLGGCGVERVPVVRTLAELEASPVVMVDGEKIHLGIEAERCALGSGVLLYCVPVGGSYGKETSGREWENQLGPVRVELSYPGVPEIRREFDFVVQCFEDVDNPVLFVLGVRPRREGVCTIRISALAGELVAQRTIRVPKREASPWMGFNALALRDADGLLRRYELAGSRGVPQYDGKLPRSKVAVLPRLWPQQTDPELKVSMEHGVIHVWSKPWVYNDLDSWLIRWWINGKPVMHDIPGSKKIATCRDIMGSMRSPKEFAFRLEAVVKTLGAEPGDVVEFQLMYCPDGIDWEGNASMANMISEREGVRLSNKARWSP